MRYVAAIGSRYGALAVQFLLVLLVTNKLPQTEAGLYFAAFGLVATLFCIVGFGLPDGLVITIGQAISMGRTAIIGDALRRSLLRGAISALFIFSLVAAGLILAGQDPAYGFLTAVWGMLYGMVFVASQGLIALRAAALGSFFFYSATNFFLLCTSVPYLLLAPSPNLIELMVVTIIAAFLSACTGILFLYLRARNYDGNERAELEQPARAGATIALSRVMQASIPWIPVWSLTAAGYLDQAAIYSVASRLTVGVTSIIAALRFSTRSELVALYASGNIAAIINLNHRASLASAAPPLLAFAFLALFGQPLVPFMFGDNYAPAVHVIMVLVMGAFAEAFGGLSDEILKMTGRTRIVLWSLGTGLIAQCVLTGLLVDYGAQAVAWAAVAAFTIQYVWQVTWLSIYTPIRLIGRKRL